MEHWCILSVLDQEMRLQPSFLSVSCLWCGADYFTWACSLSYKLEVEEEVGKMD